MCCHLPINASPLYIDLSVSYKCKFKVASHYVTTKFITDFWRLCRHLLASFVLFFFRDHLRIFFFNALTRISHFLSTKLETSDEPLWTSDETPLILAIPKSKPRFYAIIWQKLCFSAILWRKPWPFLRS